MIELYDNTLRYLDLNEVYYQYTMRWARLGPVASV